MKIVHAADLHIDSPLRGLSRYEGAPTQNIRRATRRAFENLITLCLEEGAAALLLVGDLFDGDWKDYSTGLFFLKQISRLRECGTSLYIVRGNHDASSQITKGLPFPDHCHELSTKEAQTLVNEQLGLAIHGQGYASRAVTEDLAASYPERKRDLLNVGLLHTSMEGREGHERYAPTNLDVLNSKGYDYWALGHIHEREVLSRDPWVVFPGNLQGRHMRETGEKGATVIEIINERITDVSHRALDVMRWARCMVDASKAHDADEVVELAAHCLDDAAAKAGDRLLAARVVIQGASHAHAQLLANPEKWENEIRARAIDSSVGALWIERVSFETRSEQDLQMLAERSDALGQVLRGFAAVRQDDEAIRVLAEQLADLRNVLPPELREGPDGVDLEDLGTLRELLAEAEQSILPRLFAAEVD